MEADGRIGKGMIGTVGPSEEAKKLGRRLGRRRLGGGVGRTLERLGWQRGRGGKWVARGERGFRVRRWGRFFGSTFVFEGFSGFFEGF